MTTYTYSPEAFIATIAEAHNSATVEFSHYDEVVGGAIATLIRRNVPGTRRKIEERLGIRDGVLTLIVNGRGRHTPVVTTADWEAILRELGAQGANLEGWANYPDLLRDLFLLAGFGFGEAKFEEILASCGTEWRHLPNEFAAWKRGDFTTRSRTLLDRVLSIDLHKSDNGEAYCDALHCWSDFTGRDTENLPQ